jgi:prepilin-type N-terminal cleavage/methylation domain-containing protein
MSKFLKSGFTLIELVLALAIASMFLALVGGGLVVVTKQDRAAAADRTSRYELQRALSFMGNEVQMSEFVNPCPPNSTDIYSPASNSSDHYPVLVLTMPIESGLTKPIVYYVAAPPKASVWSGPLVIYRWGPTLNLDGSYSPDKSTTHYSYYNEVVVDKITDKISDKITVADLSTACDNVFTTAVPDQTQGFSACVEPSGSAVKLSAVRSSDAGRKDILLSSVFSRRSQKMTVANAPTCPTK